MLEWMRLPRLQRGLYSAEARTFQKERFAESSHMRGTRGARLDRIKHWAGLPLQAAKACFQGLQADHIAISRNPKAHLTDKLFRVILRLHTW
jgi:hypothetical protein